MSNYTKLTDFASKDALPSGNANKIVKGTEIDDEFEAIETAIGTKADLGSPALTGTPTAPTASVGTDTTQVATTAFVQDAVEKAGHVDTAQLADDAVTTAKLATTGVTAGTYGSASAIPAITVNAEGQVTSATTASVSQPTFSVTSSNATFGNDTTVSIPSNCVMVSGTAFHSTIGSKGSRLSVELRTSSNTVIDTLILTGSNELNGVDGGSGMSARSSFSFFVPSNCANVRFYRSAGSNSISGEVGQFLIYS